MTDVSGKSGLPRTEPFAHPLPPGDIPAPVLIGALYRNFYERGRPDQIGNLWRETGNRRNMAALISANPETARQALLELVYPASSGISAALERLRIFARSDPDPGKRALAARLLEQVTDNIRQLEGTYYQRHRRFHLLFATPEFVSQIDASFQFQLALQCLWEVEMESFELNNSIQELDAQDPDAPKKWRQLLDDYSEKMAHLLELRAARAKPEVAEDYANLMSVAGNFFQIFASAHESLVSFAEQGGAWEDAVGGLRRSEELMRHLLDKKDFGQIQVRASRIINEWLEANFDSAEEIEDGMIFREDHSFGQDPVIVSGLPLHYWIQNDKGDDQYARRDPVIGPLLLITGRTFQLVYDSDSKTLYAKILEDRMGKIEREGGFFLDPGENYDSANIIGCRYEMQDVSLVETIPLMQGALELYLMADGHGFEGELAAKMAVTAFREKMIELLDDQTPLSEEAVRLAIAHADLVINRNLALGGAVFVGLIRQGATAFMVNVGDARGYRVTGQGI
ncbi:MAG: hypothetical protein Q7T11_04135, partial [Deltaproteobacteria bacterium]|nr:hypothetical protein [Deltaproteobacteria bacterium]